MKLSAPIFLIIATVGGFTTGAYLDGEVSPHSFSVPMQIMDYIDTPNMSIFQTAEMSGQVQSIIDHAIIDFNIKQIPDGEFFRNVVDQCIFRSEESFDPLCIKCVFKDRIGTEVAKGEIIELDQTYVKDTEIPIEMMSISPAKPPYPDVTDVHSVKITLCGEVCVPTFADFTQLKHGASQTVINNAMASVGITVSAVANMPGGFSQVIIFDGDTPGGPTDTDAQPDPDLRKSGYCPGCAGKRILIIPENIGGIGDGFVDIPDDSAKGGTIKVEMRKPMFLKSFLLVDLENNKYSKAVAYDSANNVIKKVEPLPNTGDGKVLTVNMDAPNTKRLEVTYKDSGGITNIDLRCKPPGEGCSLGFWKNHPEAWKTYTTGQKYSATFGLISPQADLTIKVGSDIKLKDVTLLNALSAQGGGLNNLARQSVAALLNSAALPLTYPYTTAQVLSLTKAAIIAGGSQIDNLATDFDAANNLEGPLCKGTVSCECKKPDKFAVTYNGPSGVTVEIYKSINDANAGTNRLYKFPVTFSNGATITLDSNAHLGQSTVNANTVYKFIKDGKSTVVSIHTSCSQPLFVGQTFSGTGTMGEIKLTVVSGTLKGIPSIPNQSCTAPVQPKVIFSNGFEDPKEISNWKFDSSRSGVAINGPQKLEILSTDNADPAKARTGTKYLGGSGDFEPKYAAYNRSIDVSAYHGVQVSLWYSSEDTETDDAYALYYKDGSNWIPIKEVPSSELNSSSGQTTWKNVIKSIPDSVDTLVIQYRWYTSSTSEHMMLDDLEITGIPN